MSLQNLLEAAKIVELRETKDTRLHYVSAGVIRKDRKHTKRSQTYRATHNQLEKNRRAHLRDCLVSLRDLVPSSPDQTKVTTLSLLQSARQYIKVLESHDREAVIMKRNLCLEQQRLRKQLSLLLNSYNNSNNTVIRCTSESSTGTAVSSEEEIDVENDDETGYGSADDRLSTSSGTSSNSVL